jgi:hypothetical protein
MKYRQYQRYLMYLVATLLIGCGLDLIVLNRTQRLRRDIVGTWRGMLRIVLHMGLSHSKRTVSLTFIAVATIPLLTLC